MQPETDGKTPEEFWQARYENATGETSGKPTHTLERFVSGRKPGEALDLGCARGDDTVWLARQGWQVLGVDIAQAALDHTMANAERNNVSGHIRLERHDLSLTFPQGRFDLVTASFLQTPYDFPWEYVIRRAAAALRPGKVDTAMQVEIRDSDPAQFPRGDEWREVHRRGELLSPEIPARAILWLASRFGATANGHTLSISDPDFRAWVEKDLKPYL